MRQTIALSKFGTDQQQPFGAGLRRRDLQQRDQFSGRGEPVLGDAVVAELAEFFEPDAAVAQDLDERPRPEGFAFLARQVGARSAAGGAGEDASGVSGGGREPAEGLPAAGEGTAGQGLAGLFQQGRAGQAVLADGVR
jgi:hypothetical protein